MLACGEAAGGETDCLMRGRGRALEEEDEDEAGALASRGESEDHQPERRLPRDGLPGIGGLPGPFSLLVAKCSGAFFCLVENEKPSGRSTGDVGRESPALEDDSEPERGYGAAFPDGSSLERLSRLWRSSSERTD
jgi:hypothetical protein